MNAQRWAAGGSIWTCRVERAVQAVRGRLGSLGAAHPAVSVVNVVDFDCVLVRYCHPLAALALDQSIITAAFRPRVPALERH